VNFSSPPALQNPNGGSIVPTLATLTLYQINLTGVPFFSLSTTHEYFVFFPSPIGTHATPELTAPHVDKGHPVGSKCGVFLPLLASFQAFVRNRTHPAAAHEEVLFALSRPIELF